MTGDLEFSGERFVPGIAGEIAHEHWHRYAFARRFVKGKNVLDVACGEGYGSALLAGVAASVVGVDIAVEATDHAREAYAKLPNVRFLQGSAARLDLADASVDVVVSFETIEHLPKTEQPRMIAEIGRVLKHDGMLILSAPNPVEYSQARSYCNPFHLHEPTREELDALLAAEFPFRRWFRQRRYFGSALWSEDGGDGAEAWSGDAQGVNTAALPEAMYFVVLAARDSVQFEMTHPAMSLFSDRNDAELTRIDSRESEVMRLDELLRIANAQLDRQTHHLHHLEALVAERDRILAERDAQLAAAQVAHGTVIAERDAAMHERDRTAKALADVTRAFKAEGERLERAIAAQERIISYRQSARWWLALPWLRIKLWWKSVRGA